MNGEKEQTPSGKSTSHHAKNLLLISSLAAYGVMRKGHYRVALQFYSRTGGGGINLIKNEPEKREQRIFAIDYHPFWNQKTRKKEWLLHYHREKGKEIKEHRPYDGKW